VLIVVLGVDETGELLLLLEDMGILEGGAGDAGIELGICAPLVHPKLSAENIIGGGAFRQALETVLPHRYNSIQ
jgi:hypothetical protein